MTDEELYKKGFIKVGKFFMKKNIIYFKDKSGTYRGYDYSALNHAINFLKYKIERDYC